MGISRDVIGCRMRWVSSMMVDWKSGDFSRFFHGKKPNRFMVMVGTSWNLEVYRTNYCWYGCLKRWYGIHKTFGYILFPLTKSCLKSEPEEKGPPKIWSPVMFVASISSFYPPFAKRRILRKLRQHLAISLELTFLLALLAFIGMKIELLIAWGWHDFDLTWTHWLTQGKYGYLTRIDLLLYCYILGMNRMYTTHSKNCSWFYHITSGIHGMFGTPPLPGKHWNHWHCRNSFPRRILRMSFPQHSPTVPPWKPSTRWTRMNSIPSALSI